MSPLHPSLHCPDNPAEEIEYVGVEEEPQRNKTLHIKKTDTHEFSKTKAVCTEPPWVYIRGSPRVERSEQHMLTSLIQNQSPFRST